MTNFIRTHKNKIIAVLAGIFVPTMIFAARVQFKSLDPLPSTGTAINCMVQGACSILVSGGSSSISEASQPSSDMKFGASSGTETASFGGTASSTGFSTTGAVTSSVGFVGAVTSTIGNNNGSIALFSNIGTVTSTWQSATGTCFSVVSPTGTRVWLTWSGGANGSWTSAVTNCQ